MKTFLDAAVWRSCDKDDVTRRVLGEVAQEFMTLVFDPPIGAARTRRNVSLVDDDEVRSIAQKCVAMAAPIGLHKVDARHEIWVIPVDRNILARAFAFEARHLRR